MERSSDIPRQEPTAIPWLSIGMALVDAAYTEEGAKVEVEVRGRMVEAFGGSITIL